MSAGYEYIARMDADDISELNRFERQIQYFDEHPKVECLGTWAVEIMGDGGEYYRKQMPESHEDCKKLFRKRDCMIHPTVIFDVRILRNRDCIRWTLTLVKIL